MLKYFTLLTLVLFVSCKDSNQKLENYNQSYENNKKTFFAIESENPKNVYITENMEFNFDSIYFTKFSYYARNDKFFAKSLKPETDYFMIFDLNAELNKSKKIVIKSGRKLKFFDCIFEKKIETKEKLKVGVFRIKKWAKLPDFFGGSEMDIIVFLNSKYGVIGSYYELIEKNNEKVMIAPAGEILKNYIDYSQIREGKLL